MWRKSSGGRNCIPLAGTNRSPSAQSPVKGQVICRIQTPAGREALGKAGDGDVGERLTDGLGQIVGSSFAFHVGSRGKDDFLDGSIAQTLQKGSNAEVLRANIIERAEAAVQSVILALECTGAFQWKNVRGLFNNTELGGIARWVSTNQASIANTGKEAAGRTEPDAGGGHGEGAGEIGRGGLGGAQEPDGNTFRTARTDARKAFQLGNQQPDLLRIINSAHRRRGSLRPDWPLRRGVGEGAAGAGSGGVGIILPCGGSGAPERGEGSGIWPCEAASRCA